MAMSDNERFLLIEALGRANTALSLVRVVIQMLGERGLVPPELLLEMIDSGMVDLEEFRPDSLMGPCSFVSIRTYSTTCVQFRVFSPSHCHELCKRVVKR
jgi:hypothetical protein